jgi:hydroxyacylglutathione hydrolase
MKHDMEVNPVRKINIYSLILMAISVFVISCSQPGELAVHSHVTGPGQTNCYLIYDTSTKDAALIDVGGPIDPLVAFIENNDLRLKYIFATHCHMDHIEGVPQMQERFPDALLCYNRKDYEDFLVSIDWMEEHKPEMINQMKQSPDLRRWFEYDMSIFVKPDIFLEDNQTYKLGKLEIRTLLAPGHSSGSICFYVKDVLFSGDVLFYRQVGRTDLLGGSKEAIIRSVQKLYRELPETTKVYPGHGEETDIGSEKRSNEEVSADVVSVKN